MRKKIIVAILYILHVLWRTASVENDHRQRQRDRETTLSCVCITRLIVPVCYRALYSE